MQQLMGFFDDSAKLSQTPNVLRLAYHPQQKQYQIIHQALIIPNLPAPLHYFNFFSLIGQPNVPIFLNRSALIDENFKNTATVISSISPHMHGHFNHYNIQKECYFNEEDYQFGTRERLTGTFPYFQFVREDAEMSIDIQIKTTHLITHFNKLKLAVFDHWSLLCECTGKIQYQNQTYHIQQLGAFEYARAVNFPYLPLSFFTYQIINLDQHTQLLLEQVRNNFNQIMQSRLYIRDLSAQTVQIFDKNVRFINHRIYPAVTTPNGQHMYLPREFEWQYEDKEHRLQVTAQSRGDFKFGLAAGYVGSFNYQVQWGCQGGQQDYIGESGYCEYIDCRPLSWQETTKEEKLLDDLANTVPILLKK